MEQKDVLKALQRDHAAELKLAAERLKGTARHTEIIPSPVLSEMTGHEILLKPENLQVTGSFKIRGAYNKIASLTEEQIAHGIVTASAGNHAQGVAYAARERGAKATICMPQITPPLKVDATRPTVPTWCCTAMCSMNPPPTLLSSRQGRHDLRAAIRRLRSHLRPRHHRSGDP